MKYLYRFLDFHKRNHSLLLLVEEFILCGIIFIMSFVTRVSIFTPSVDGAIETFNQYTFSMYDDTFIAYIIPSLTALIVFIFTIIIEIMKRFFSKGILSKKLTKPLFAMAVVSFFLDIPLLYIFNYYSVNSGTEIIQYSHRLAYIITCMCHVLIAVDIYIWRSEFGLEKLYGEKK